MPRRTIFVRDDDLDAFEAITDRPGWLRWAIRNAKKYQCICDKFPAPHQHLVTDEVSSSIRPDLGGKKIGNLEQADRVMPDEEDPTTYISEDEMP